MSEEENKGSGIWPKAVTVVSTVILVWAFWLGWEAECLTQARSQLLRTLIALMGAGYGSALTGLLTVDLSLGKKATIQGTQAMAVFLVLYFFVPAESFAGDLCPGDQVTLTGLVSFVGSGGAAANVGVLDHERGVETTSGDDGRFHLPTVRRDGMSLTFRYAGRDTVVPVDSSGLYQVVVAPPGHARAGQAVSIDAAWEAGEPADCAPYTGAAPDFSLSTRFDVAPVGEEEEGWVTVELSADRAIRYAGFAYTGGAPAGAQPVAVAVDGETHRRRWQVQHTEETLSVQLLLCVAPGDGVEQITPRSYYQPLLT